MGWQDCPNLKGRAPFSLASIHILLRAVLVGLATRRFSFPDCEATNLIVSKLGCLSNPLDTGKRQDCRTEKVKVKVKLATEEQEKWERPFTELLTPFSYFWKDNVGWLVWCWIIILSDFSSISKEWSWVQFNSCCVYIYIYNLTRGYSSKGNWSQCVRMYLHIYIGCQILRHFTDAAGGLQLAIRIGNC